MTPLERLGVQLPIVQAPMAGVSTPELAAAVSNAGALGSLGVGAVDASGGRAMIEATRARTHLAFNVNLFVHGPAASDPLRERGLAGGFAPAVRELRSETARGVAHHLPKLPR